MSNGRPATVAVSRRDALGTMVGAGFVAMAGGAIAQPVAAETPKRGGRIRVAGMSSSTADTLDPARGSLSTDYTRHYMLYSGLTQYDEHLKPQLALAESIETRDRVLWTIKLRKDVSFHDGSSLTASDVVYSLMRHKIPAMASKAATIATQFQEAKAVGPLEVQIQLIGPNADLPSILAASHFLVVKDGTVDFQTANGTGPYICKDFKPGVRTVATRNANYWKSGRPYLDEIELIGIPDEVSRVNALLSGDVQLIIAINPRSIRRIRSIQGFVVQETPSGLYTNLIMRQDAEPTSDPNFVLAMKHLFDRDLIQKAVFRGFATIANDHPIPPSNPYYLQDLPVRTYDPDRAKFLLQKAGLLNVRLPMYASPAAEESVDIGSVLQEAAANIGLTLAVNRVPADGYWSNHWMKHPLSFGNTNPRPTADLIFGQFYKSDAPWNESGWKNAQFDQLLLAARGEADEVKRKQMYGDMQLLVHEYCGVGLPVFISLMDAHDQRLKGYGSIPLGGLMGYMFAEHVWLDS
ncbi:MAG: ABC transporter substrate-binding protein [Rhodospirillaceae bacterium]|nr:MAG: ABC transporter substrate-binding protein [Rhodospirillaceae bacterium]